jgi:hypothetical protein
MRNADIFLGTKDYANWRRVDEASFIVSSQITSRP